MNEQRKTERVTVTIQAQMSILIPENTFNPLNHPCQLVDLSERGAMVIVKLAQETYSAMLKKTRYCQIQFPEDLGLPKKVTGRAVWLQPHVVGQDRTFRIGLFFEDCPAEIVSKVRSYVANMKK